MIDDTEIAAILRRRDELKGRDPGAVYLFRVEDGYMMLDSDAWLIVHLPPFDPLLRTEIRGGADDSAIVPAEHLDVVLSRLRAAGRRVVVVEPHDGPAPPGAKVERVVEEGDVPVDHADNAPSDRARHPMQPIVRDKDGVPRFEANAIVSRLLDEGGIDMDRIARWDVSDEARMQFAQLIGYSVGGYGELHYVADESYEQAEAMARGIPTAQDGPGRPGEEDGR